MIDGAHDSIENGVLSDAAYFAEFPPTLADLFLASATKFDLPDALNYKKNGEWLPISSSEIIRRSENISLGLHSIGLRKGDRAAILAANSPEWTLTDAGCQFGGVIDVPIYTTSANKAISTSSTIRKPASSFCKTGRHTNGSCQRSKNADLWKK